MQGKFKSMGFRLVFSLFFLLIGTGLCIRFGTWGIAELQNSQLASSIFCFGFALFGILLGCLGILLLRFNYGAYLCADASGISGRFGLSDPVTIPYHEIEWVTLELNAFHLRLKDRRTISVYLLTNAEELYQYIRPHLSLRQFVDIPQCSQKIKRLQYRRIVCLTGLFVSLCLMFGSLIFCVIRTNGKDIADFDRQDNITFLGCAVFGLAMVIIAFLLADYSGKLNRHILDLHGQLTCAAAYLGRMDGLDRYGADLIGVKFFETCTYRIIMLHVLDEKIGYRYCFTLEEFLLVTCTWRPCPGLGFWTFHTLAEMEEAIDERYGDELMNE